MNNMRQLVAFISGLFAGAVIIATINVGIGIWYINRRLRVR